MERFHRGIVKLFGISPKRFYIQTLVGAIIGIILGRLVP